MLARTAENRQLHCFVMHRWYGQSCGQGLCALLFGDNWCQNALHQVQVSEAFYCSKGIGIGSVGSKVMRRVRIIEF